MQEEPRNISFSHLLTWAAWITFAAIARLSYRNSARSVLLATNHLLTAVWSRRSTSERVSVWSSTSSCNSRRISAAPTMPRWPATKTVLPFSSNGVLAIGDLPPRDLKVARNHLFHELG